MLATTDYSLAPRGRRTCHLKLLVRRRLSAVLSQTLQLKSARSEIRTLSKWVDHFADEAGMSSERRVNFQVALEELATNVIRHAYRESGADLFSVTLTREDEEVVAVVTDEGPAFNPLERPPVETRAPFEDRPIGGLGILLVRELIDSIDYRREGRRNVLTLRCPRLGSRA